MDKKRMVIFLGIIGIAVITLGLFLLLKPRYDFDYKGVGFYIENESGKVLYKTSLPVTYTDQITGKVTQGDYDFYFKNDPRTLEREVPFLGDINLKEYTVLNMTNEFEECTDNQIIPLQNLINFYKMIGIRPIKNETAGCDDLYGKYSWVGIQKEEETKIVEWGVRGGCYNVNIKSCEDIAITIERLTLEMLERLNQLK